MWRWWGVGRLELKNDYDIIVYIIHSTWAGSSGEGIQRD